MWISILLYLIDAIQFLRVLLYHLRFPVNKVPVGVFLLWSWYRAPHPLRQTAVNQIGFQSLQEMRNKTVKTVNILQRTNNCPKFRISCPSKAIDLEDLDTPPKFCMEFPFPSTDSQVNTCTFQSHPGICAEWRQQQTWNKTWPWA